MAVLMEKSVTSMFDKAGSWTRSGIISGAQTIGKGISATSELIKNNTSEHTEALDVGILPEIEAASKTTSYLLTSSHQLLGKATNSAIEAVEKRMPESSEESETMKKIKANQVFKTTVNVTKSGVGAALNILDGVNEGISIVKDSSVQATVDVVEHKYGENAAKATKESFNIAGDVTGAVKMANVGAIASISATEALKIREEKEIAENAIRTLTFIVI